MIIRETDQHFICIEQDKHAHIAKHMIAQWKDYLLKNDPFSDDVLYAVEQHDVGWHYFDQQPFWNDETNAPHTFIDLPLLTKTVLYTYGVDLVEKRNPYAAALCSAHYTKFLQKYEKDEVKQYVANEQLRRKLILQNYPEIDEETFEKHLALLQLADNMSLYICLHEPGNNEDKHRYFARGIFIPSAIDSKDIQFIEASWQDEDTLTLRNVEKVAPFSIELAEKIVPKQKIKSEGFSTSYEQTPITKRTINFTS